MDAARDAARATDPAGVDGGDSLGLDIGGGDAEENTPPLGGDADDAAAAADAAAPASSSSAQPDAGSDASEPSLDALLDALAARESPSPLLRSPSSPARPPPPSPAVGAASTPLVGHGGRPDAAMPVTPPAKLLSEGYINSLPGHLRAAVLAHSKADSAGSPHPKSSSLVINIGRILEAEHDREGSDEMAARIAALKPHEVHESADPTAAEALWFFSTGAEAEAFLAPSQATTTRMSKSRFNVDKFEPARPRKCGTCDAADAAVVAFCTKCEHYLCQACRVGKKHRVDKPSTWCASCSTKLPSNICALYRSKLSTRTICAHGRAMPSLCAMEQVSPRSRLLSPRSRVSAVARCRQNRSTARAAP